MKIFVENLTIYAILGILEVERNNLQKVIIDVKIDYDFNKDNFLDYSLIVKSIQDTMQKDKYLLIEDALINITSTLKQKFPTINQIKLKISKPNILDNCTVGAKIKKNFKDI
jgi:dihydroneopterin aldolase